MSNIIEVNFKNKIQHGIDLDRKYLEGTFGTSDDWDDVIAVYLLQQLKQQ